ncbi:MAG: hypothetical protein ACE5SW_02260 [Nitrososphaeraceae archaeon]
MEEIIYLSHIVSPSKIPEYLTSKRFEIETIHRETEQKNQLLLEVEDKITKAQNNLADILEKENLSLQTI